MASKSEKIKTLLTHSATVGDDTVVLIGTPPRMRTNKSIRIFAGGQKSEAVSETRPLERNLYEIRVNGAHVGFASRGYGVGKQQFVIERLGYSDISSNRIAHGRGSPYNDVKLFELQEVAQTAAALRSKVDHKTKLPILHTLEEFEEFRAAEAEANRIAEEERAADRRRWDAELKASQAAEKQKRLDTVDGLKSIDERLGKSLTNFEMDALKRAIEHFSKNPNAYWDDHPLTNREPTEG
jgi:hypothetical protein